MAPPICDLEVHCRPHFDMRNEPDHLPDKEPWDPLGFVVLVVLVVRRLVTQRRALRAELRELRERVRLLSAELVRAHRAIEALALAQKKPSTEKGMLFWTAVGAVAAVIAALAAILGRAGLVLFFWLAVHGLLVLPHASGALIWRKREQVGRLSGACFSPQAA